MCIHVCSRVFGSQGENSCVLGSQGVYSCDCKGKVLLHTASILARRIAETIEGGEKGILGVRLLQDDAQGDIIWYGRPASTCSAIVL